MLKLCLNQGRFCATGPSLQGWQNIRSKVIAAVQWHRNGTAWYHGATKLGDSDGAFKVNLRSDTFTMPTAAMKEAMVTAPLGDDVYGEDPTVNKLQEECAKLLGKEACLLVPTGTMGNIISILTHCSQRFQEVLLGDQSHIYLYEVGGIAALAGVQPRAVANQPDGTLDLEELQKKIRPRIDPHNPWTRMICLENTQNKCGGKVLSMDYIRQVREVADANELMLHLDGARMMNAAAALGVAVSDITHHFDSISMCFSKGLSCPVGSIVAGSNEFIKRALWARKALGGGMRQAGVIAAPMLVSLKEIVPKLQDDHARIRKIAQAVADLGDDSVATVDIDDVHTNIIMLQTTKSHTSAAQIAERLEQVTEAELSVLGEKITVSAQPFSDTTVRLVTHHEITDQDVDKVIKKLQYVLTNMAAV